MSHAELIFSFYLILAIYAHILVSRRQHELILAIYAHILGTYAGLSSHFTSCKCPHAELIFSFYLILAIYAHILGTQQIVVIWMRRLFAHI